MELAGLCHCLPFLWAVVPLTVEDSIVPTTPEVGGMNFPLPAMASIAEYFSNPHSLCWTWGCWTGGFLLFTFLLELDSSFPQDRLAGHCSCLGSSRWSLESPNDLYKGVWGRVRIILTPNLFSLKKEKNTQRAHNVNLSQSQIKVL